MDSKMRQISISLILFFTLTSSVFAHDGSIHTTDLEVWVAGIGIVLILMAGIYSFVWRKPDWDESPEIDDSNPEDSLS